MAAPIAHETPSIQKAWQAFLQHIPVVLVIWVGSIVLSLGRTVEILEIPAHLKGSYKQLANYIHPDKHQHNLTMNDPG